MVAVLEAQLQLAQAESVSQRSVTHFVVRYRSIVSSVSQKGPVCKIRTLLATASCVAHQLL
jgi:hypothetical protein